MSNGRPHPVLFLSIGTKSDTVKELAVFTESLPIILKDYCKLCMMYMFHSKKLNIQKSISQIKSIKGEFLGFLLLVIRRPVSTHLGSISANKFTNCIYKLSPHVSNPCVPLKYLFVKMYDHTGYKNT
jgi:hypothetical protein